MDPIENPYAPTAGAQPPELTGRDQILKDAAIAIARIKRGRYERGMLLTGLRGVGKTVLLNRIKDISLAEKFSVDLIEAPEDRPFAPIVASSLRKAVVRMDVAEKAKAFAEQAMRVLKSFSLSMKLGEAEFALRNEPAPGTADTGDIERDLPDLFVAIGETAKANNSGIALLIDEIQYLSQSDLAALIVSVHRVAQNNLPILLMGAGLPSLPALSGDAKSYAERLFKYPRIGALQAEDAKRALTEPARNLGVEYEADALSEIFRTTAGYPYFVQEWGYVVWNLAAQSPITVADVLMASDEATRRLDENFFRVRLDRVTDAEQRYLRGMAELGQGPHRVGDVAKAFKRKTASFGPVRDALIKKGMVYSPKHGVIDFTVPLFDQFMRRAMPEFRA